MQVATEMENSKFVDAENYLRQKEELKDKHDEFMRKYLRRAWPVRTIRLLGLIQLIISLAVLGVDFPIILMFAPRWQIFAGCWAFIVGFITSVSTIHSTRKMTWSILKWAVRFNIIGGITAGILVAFNILYLVNPYTCIISGGCTYLSYTYAPAKSFYTGEVILGFFFLISAFVFLVFFIKYGIGGTALFEDIEKGIVTANFDPIVIPHGAKPVARNPTTGAGVMMTTARNHPQMPQYPPPPGSVMMQGQHRQMVMPGPQGSMMMQRPGGPMMMQRPGGPMMMPGPGGHMMMPGPRYPMMPPDPRGPPMQGYYRPPGPPPGHPYQN